MDLEQYFVTVKIYEGNTVVATKEDIPMYEIGDFLLNFIKTDKTKIEVIDSDGTVKNLILH